MKAKKKEKNKYNYEFSSFFSFFFFVVDDKHSLHKYITFMVRLRHSSRHRRIIYIHVAIIIIIIGY